MKTVTTLAANKLGKLLTKEFGQIFGPTHDDVGERRGSLARCTIECLGRSDALYQNFEHTLLVRLSLADLNARSMQKVILILPIIPQ